MKRIISLFLIFAFLIPFNIVLAEENGEIEIFVSLSGSDSNDGSFEKPLATLNSAKEKVKSLNDGTKNITVNFMPGEYPVSSTVSFTEEDSGFDGAKITYKAYNGGEVKFTGYKNIPVSGFKEITDSGTLSKLAEEARGNVKKISLWAYGISSLPDTTITTGSGAYYQAPYPMLFADGEEQILAKYPNDGYNRLKAEDIVSGAEPKPVSFYISEEKASKWKNAGEAFIDGYFKYTYAYEQSRFSIDEENNILTTAERLSYGCDSGGRWRINNLLEEIDIPGEYYIDKKNLVLYYYPEKELSETEIKLAVFDGDIINAENLKNVEFSGFTFEKSLGNAIVMSDCRNIQIENCNFYDLGKCGVRAEKMYKASVSDCDFKNIGGNAIHMNGGDRATLTSSECVIKNNTIEKYAEKNIGGGQAINVSGVGFTVKNNTIHDGPLGAIIYSGNDNLITHNEIFNVNKESMDVGAIYSGRDWAARGNEVSYNYLHDIKSSESGTNSVAIYLDDMLSGINVHHNVIYNVTLGMLIGGGRDNKIESNIIIGCEYPINFDNRGENWANASTLPGGAIYEKLISLPYDSELYLEKYPELEGILEDEPEKAKGSIIRNNLLYKNENIYSFSETAKVYARVFEQPITTADAEGVSYIMNQGESVEDESGNLNMPGNGEIKIDDVLFSEISEIKYKNLTKKYDFEDYVAGEIPSTGMEIVIKNKDNVNVDSAIVQVDPVTQSKALKIVKTDNPYDLEFSFIFPKTTKKVVEISFDMRFENAVKRMYPFARLLEGSSVLTSSYGHGTIIRYGADISQGWKSNIFDMSTADEENYYNFKVVADFENKLYTIYVNGVRKIAYYSMNYSDAEYVDRVNFKLWGLVSDEDYAGKAGTSVIWVDDFIVTENDIITAKTLLQENKTVTELTNNTNVTVKGLLIFGVYKENGELISIQKTDISVPAMGKVSDVEVSLEVPEECEVKGFIFDSLNGLKPMSEKIIPE